jgi:UDP-N-acetylglucosamine 2-epimerase (non-hydrolysing)
MPGSRWGDRHRVKILHVVGARPNFPKLAPVFRSAAAAQIEQVIVHTGQHYDDGMSDAFFRELGLRAPDVNLGVGSATHAVQTARIMERIEPVLLEQAADWVIVYGDVNSTAAAALVAVKIAQRVAHVEAGVRSHDWRMPEEVNRVVVDRLASLLLTPSHTADATLRAEGEPESEIVFVGNVMVDALLFAVDRARSTGFRHQVAAAGGDAVAVTMHRPSNVDDRERLAAIMAALRAIADRRPVIFPAHPRTHARIVAGGLETGRIHLMGPIGYLEMLDLVDAASVLITDSGGLQVESAALGVPCLTVRDTTEWPETIACGANRLVFDPALLSAAVHDARRLPTPPRPEGWDGKASLRIIDALRRR